MDREKVSEPVMAGSLSDGRQKGGRHNALGDFCKVAQEPNRRRGFGFSNDGRPAVILSYSPILGQFSG
jgi:hypothetical protein